MSKLQVRGQKTKERIIHTAFDLFHKQGVNATSVDEILEKSNTGKSQFYHYFKGKDDLTHQVVQSFYRSLCNKEIPINYEIESLNDLENWFYFFINHQKSTNCERGCPMATIGYELKDYQELIRQDINLTFEYTINALSKFFHKQKALGKLKKDTDPDELASFCVFIMQGGMITSKIKKETISFESSVKHALAYINSLSR